MSPYQGGCPCAVRGPRRVAPCRGGTKLAAVEIVAVAPGAELPEAFLTLPWRIYPGVHAWVPPLRAAVAQELSSANLFFRHGEAQAFVARRDGQAVGRVVASVDDALRNPRIGHFGYFEAIEDPDVAHALLGAAARWVLARGRTALHGPVDLSIYHRYRVQTAGFETGPFYGEPRHPAYYAPMLAAAGFTPVARWFSWDLPAATFAPFQAAMAARTSRQEAPGLAAYAIAPFDLTRFDDACRALHPLVVETFQEGYGAAHVDADEFLQRFGDARHFMSGTASHQALDADGRMVGYSYAYPDPGPDFVAADGDAARFAFTPPDRDRLFIAHTFGIAQAHRRSGLAERLFELGIAGMADRHAHAVGALAKEGPAAYARFGAPSRAYAVFGRELG